MIESIIGQQECDNRANNNSVPVQYGPGTGMNNNSTRTVIGYSSGTGNE
jgi:hypothetical protein